MSRPRALPHGLKDIARVAALASLCWPLACAPPAAAPAPSPESPAKAPASTQEPVAEAAAPAPAGPTTPVLLVTARDVLDPLTQAGLDLGARAFGQTATSLAELATAPAYRDLRDTLARDLEADAARDPRAGVGMKHPHRQFDITWLDSDKTRFELIAAVNRVDRRPFAPERCGETRLIYRLAYSTTLAGEPLSSRLPMTVNVVFWQDPEGAAEGDRCRDVARRWLAPEGLSGAALARWLTRPEGPLAPERLTAARLKSVEVNLQSVRWPSVVHPSLAGHAEYILRVFHPRDGRLAPAPIENTPDVERLRRDDAARAELLTWLKDPERLAAIEAGTVNVPERFLADKAVSVTPRALARIANRPYAQLFQPSDFEGVASADGEHVRSAKGLLRRLDGLTCNGCHEARSVAGFHVLGEEPDPKARLDALAVFTSPHLDGELVRREAYVTRLAAGEAVDEARPLADVEPHQGAYGTHCGLGDPGFAHWRCDPGLACRDLGDTEVGTCLREEGRYAGDPCEIGRMRSFPVAHRDRMVGASRDTCDAGVCNPNNIGFPMGMCIRGCDRLRDGERCGAMVSLRPFNNCIGQRRRFTECLTETARRAGMRACGPAQPCRDDYICARSPNDDGGVCLPPYFLFQLRVDGHVL